MTCLGKVRCFINRLGRLIVVVLFRNDFWEDWEIGGIFERRFIVVELMGGIMFWMVFKGSFWRRK